MPVFKYLPASFLYTSRASASERTEIDRRYMPFVLENAHKASLDVNNVRTDYFDRTTETWGAFVEIIFQHFFAFANEHLVNRGAYVVRIRPWFNYYASGSAMIHHSHPGNDFGLIYCLRNAGKKKTLFNTFSHEYACMEDKYPKIDHCTISWNPDPGDFAFFPASLFHATERADVDGERITLVANIVMAGEGDSEKLSLRVEQF